MGAAAAAEAAEGVAALGRGGNSGSSSSTRRIRTMTRPARRRDAGPLDASHRRRNAPGPLLPLLLSAAAVALVVAAPAATAAAAALPNPHALTPTSSSWSSQQQQLPPLSALPDPTDPNRDQGLTAPYSTALAPSSSVAALFCPNGGALEGGLCYPRCRLGWRGVGCTCWKDGLTYARGCGTRPALCEATSFRKNPLPPIIDVVGAGAAEEEESGDGFGGSGSTTLATSSSNNGGASVTLVLSADPQLFRNGSSPLARATAVENNRLLARSINRVRDLGDWPQAAGGGAVAEPRALVVLGDLTELYREREADAFRHYYDPSFPGNAGERVRFPTWLMLGNHDYVNNAIGAVEQPKKTKRQEEEGGGSGGRGGSSGSSGDDEDQEDADASVSADYEPLEPPEEKAEESSSGGGGDNNKSSKKKSSKDKGHDTNPCSDKAAVAGDGAACAKRVVDEMRALLSPSCPTKHWSSFPKHNVTSFDADSMAYSFDYGRYHFVALHFSPRHRDARLGVAGSTAWLSRELSHAAAQARRVVVLVHSHGELGLTDDPTFARVIGSPGSPVVALFFGHIHVRPWGYAGTFPRTAVPMFNCGASWYNTYCVAEFAEEGLRVGAVSHMGDGKPVWFGHSAHLLAPAGGGAPLGGDGSGAGGGGGGGGAAAAAAARITGVASPPAKPALLAYEPNPRGSPWLLNGVVKEDGTDDGRWRAAAAVNRAAGMHASVAAFVGGVGGGALLLMALL